MNAVRVKATTIEDLLDPEKRAALLQDSLANPPTPITCPDNTPCVKWEDSWGQINCAEIVGGYWRGKEREEQLVLDVGRGGDSRLAIHSPSGNCLTWQGGMRSLAKERFLQTPKGAVWRYRNKPMTNMTDSEIQAFIGTYDLKII